MKDQVHIEKLRLEAVIGPDAWSQLNPQQCFITMNMQTDFGQASLSDDLRYSLNYAVISRDVTNFVKSRSNWGSLGILSRSVSDYAMSKYIGIDKLQLKAQTETAHIRSEDISCLVQRERAKTCYSSGNYDMLHISGLKILTLIGVFTFERLQKQYVTFDLYLPWPKNSPNHASYKSIINKIVEYVENSNFLTVEALVESITKLISSDLYFQEHSTLPIEVKVMKLNAITSTTGVGVSCVRTPIEMNSSELPNEPVKPIGTSQSALNLPIHTNAQKKINDGWNTVYLAFGSNVGDKLHNILLAKDLLSENTKIRLQNVSSLFESEPMYFKDQDTFVNGCIEITTTLNPQEVLELCKSIEYEEMKRVKHFDNGPRIIDLDIIMYLNSAGEHVLVDDANLTIPHARMLERSFVLEPLCELVSPDHIHPLTTEPLVDHLAQLYGRQNREDVLWKLVPLPSVNSNSTERYLKFRNIKSVDEIAKTTRRITLSPTILMGVLNATPDSFSDGGQHYSDPEKQLAYVKKICADALNLHEQVIIDIGGCSTRPNSKQTSEEEEIMRTIPLIKLIRTCEELPQDKMVISVDTYRSLVARQAIAVGADIINDISGGAFDPEMFAVVAANPKVAYVLSHTRGNISNMSRLTDYSEDSNDNSNEYLYNKLCTSPETSFIRTMSRELSKRYVNAVKSGVCRWQILLDPGIGFAKNGEQNLEIIRHISLFKNFSCVQETGYYINFRNLPIVVGPSRKNFIGKITKDVNPIDRDFATGALISSCIGFGADIVRVHNVTDCAKAVKLADAVYKGI